MRVIGFNFTKISAERFKGKPSSIEVNTDFASIEKEEIEMLKEEDALNVSFTFKVNYLREENKEEKKEKNKDQNQQDLASILEFKGIILLSVSKDESKEILKSWKKKELASGFKAFLINLIIKKCTVKSLDLEDQLNLPPHFPFPKVSPQPEKKE